MLVMLWARRWVTALLPQPSPGLETLNHGKIAGNKPLVLKKPTIVRCSHHTRSPCGCSRAEAAALPSAAACSKSKSKCLQGARWRSVPAAGPALAQLLPSQEREVTSEEGKPWRCV